MTISVRRPLSSQSEVVNEQRRWNQDWYTWLSDLTDTIGSIDTSSTTTPTSSGIVSVKDFGADGRDRLYTNIVGGSGYTGGTAQLFTAQEDYSDASWTKINTTITANAVADPRGALLADAVVETTTATVGHYVKSAMFTGPGVFRFYVEIKPSARNWVRISIGDNAGTALGLRTFYLNGTGVVGSKLERGGSAITAQSITQAANGFYQLMLEVNHVSVEVIAIVQSLLGDVFDWSGTDQHDQFTSAGVTAYYLGKSQLCGVTLYQGTVFIASDSIYPGVTLTGGSGSNAVANITVGMGQVLDVQSYAPGHNYVIGDVLSCAAADIGGTGSGFSCQVQTLGNDSVAVQAAIDSGVGGGPVTIFFPAGVYNVFPQDALSSNCLYLRNNNITLIGQGRNGTKISCFASGGRHPETGYDLQITTGMVWRGNGVWLPANSIGTEIRNLRITGNCRRHNVRYPLGDTDPLVISPGFPLGADADGDGWDLSHHCIFAATGPPKQGIRLIDCELDGWKGELIAGIGGFTQPIADPPAITNWSWWIERCYIHDCNADGISVAGNSWIVNNEIGWCTNANEFGDVASCHTIMNYNHIHDCGHGITPVQNAENSVTLHCVGQQIIKGNFIERCYKNGVFVFLLAYNVDVSDNILVDCGIDTIVSGGAIVVSLITGPRPVMNVFVRNNIMYNHSRHVRNAIGINLSIFDIVTMNGIYIEGNKLGITPNAQSLGYTWESGIGFDVATGCAVEASDNDLRLAINTYTNAFSGGITDMSHRNILDRQSNYADVNLLSSNFNKTSDTTLADVVVGRRHLRESVSGSLDAWFEATLFISAPAGGAKVTVAFNPIGGAAAFATRYDVEMWVGTAVDAASGQATAFGTVFASAAAITKIRISGFFSPNTNGYGDLSIKFAQNSSNATASSVLPGSSFQVRNFGN